MSVAKPVTSREYKLMLNISRFQDRAAGSREFWQLVTFLAQRQEDLAGPIGIEVQHEEELRDVRYLDTRGLALRRNGFVLRAREEYSADPAKRHKLTVKYRDADRYMAAGQDLSTTSTVGEAKEKFEEDVIPPFASRYSSSVAVQSPGLLEVNNIGEVKDMFPGLADLEIPNELAVEPVRGFRAHEVFHKAGKIKFGKKPKVKCARSFWYLWPERTGRPVVAEFSFDFDDKTKKERFPAHVVQGAGALFRSLQRQPGWVDFRSTTKTAYAYEAM